jgi:signal transduction histidine kinase
MASPLFGSGTFASTFRRILLLGFILLFVGLILNARVQYRLAWEDLDRNLESSLVTEGRLLAAWLARALDPIATLDPLYEEWRESASPPPLEDLTGSNWLLLDASGEVAVGSSGEPLFRWIDPATGEIASEIDIDLIRLAARNPTGEPVSSALRTSRDTLSKRVYFPVWVAPDFYSEPYVLMGQAGRGYFSELFEKQRRFWWTASLLTVASLGLLLLLIRGILRTERLEASLRDAEESVELESLTSTLAHELRNPLSIVRSSAEILLRDESLTEEGRELASDIIEEVGRTQDVLSRHLHPEREAQGEIEDIGQFARDFWKRREGHLENNRIDLTVSVRLQDDRVGVLAVPDRLEQILDNLLRNSMEASPCGAKVHFEASEASGFVAIRFRDDGPGLDESFPFRKDGWGLGSSKAEGKGIGLRLARRWIERWGGALELRNLKKGWFGPTQGAEVLIRLRRTDPS